MVCIPKLAHRVRALCLLGVGSLRPLDSLGTEDALFRTLGLTISLCLRRLGKLLGLESLTNFFVRVRPRDCDCVYCSFASRLLRIFRTTVTNRWRGSWLLGVMSTIMEVIWRTTCSPSTVPLFSGSKCLYNSFISGFEKASPHSRFMFLEKVGKSACPALGVEARIELTGAGGGGGLGTEGSFILNETGASIGSSIPASSQLSPGSTGSRGSGRLSSSEEEELSRAGRGRVNVGLGSFCFAGG